MNIIDLGLIEYLEAYEFQKKRVEEVANGISENYLLLAEHPPTITVGRLGSRKNILCTEEELRQRGISVYDIDRGGDVTYHSPGQVLLYPIIYLEHRARQIHKFLRLLEEVCIKFLKYFKIDGYRIENLTGVWVGNKKIASIGIGIKRWITYHGMATNIDNDLEGFSLINPCGINGLKMTSLKEELRTKIDLKLAKDILVRVFEEMYGFTFTKEFISTLA